MQPRHIVRTNRNNLHVPDPVGSKLTVSTAFGSQIMDPDEPGKQRMRPRRVLSSIASSSDEPNRSIGGLSKVRESKSLDPLPFTGKTK